MAITFLEPGGDATFNNGAITTNGGFWALQGGSGATAETDFVHGNHAKSFKFAPATGNSLTAPTGIVSGSGGRISLYIYLVALPNATATLFAATSSGNRNVTVRLTSTGVLQLWNTATAQIGIDGSTLSTGTWYRLCVAFTEASTTVNEFRLFKDGAIDISVTNATMTNATPNAFRVGNDTSNATLDFRTSDFYVDNSSALTDPGDVWVTAKRPNANGTANQFTTQIGTGGSGYGSGHAAQINERPLSTTNGWSVSPDVTTLIEEFTIDSAATGDINITNSTLVDFVGWITASSGASSSNGKIILKGISTTISTTTTATTFTAVAGSAVYPAGGTDIGISCFSAAGTTFNLYEAGVLVAYIPATARTVTLSDPVTVSELVTVTVSTPKPNVTDNPAASELSTIVIASAGTLALSVSDSTTVIENIGRIEDSFTNLGDSVSVSVVSTIESILLPSVSDSTAVQEFIGYYPDQVWVSELIALVYDTSNTPIPSVQDIITVSETVTLLVILYPTVSDQTAVTDTITLTYNLNLGPVSDSTAVTDTPTLVVPINATVSDSTTVGDQPTVAVSTLQVVAAESTSVGENSTVAVLSAGTFVFSVSDGTTVGDAAGRQENDLLIEGESTAVGDTPTISVQVGVSVNDSTAVTDTGTVRMQTALSVSDTTTVGETQTFAILLSFSVFDSINVNDSVTFTSVHSSNFTQVIILE